MGGRGGARRRRGRNVTWSDVMREGRPVKYSRQSGGIGRLENSDRRPHTGSSAGVALQVAKNSDNNAGVDVRNEWGSDDDVDTGVRDVRHSEHSADAGAAAPGMNEHRSDDEGESVNVNVCHDTLSPEFQQFESQHLDELEVLRSTSGIGVGDHECTDTCASPERTFVVGENRDVQMGQDFNCTEQLDSFIDAGRSGCTPSPQLRSIQSMMRLWSAPLNLTALVSVVGSIRYTVQQYEFTRNLVQDVATKMSKHSSLEDSTARYVMPSYSRLHRYFMKVIENVFPESALVQLLLKKSVSVVSRTTLGGLSSDSEENEITADPPALRAEPLQEDVEVLRGRQDESQGRTEKVRIFYPSAWAKLDVSTSVVFYAMFPDYGNTQHRLPSQHLENSTIVREREHVINSCDAVYTRHGTRTVRCQLGDSVRVTVTGEISNMFTGYGITQSTSGYELVATVGRTWCVSSRDTPIHGPEGGREIEGSDEWEHEVFIALSRGSAPLLSSGVQNSEVHPGDICTFLRSTESRGAGNCRAVLIHRYWRQIDGVPSIMIAWVKKSNGNTAEHVIRMSSMQVVENVLLDSANLVIRPNRRTASRSHGYLLDRTPYVVYRFMLYCDDFQKSAQMTQKGSAGGCYLLPLNLPPESRRSTSAVRVISLTPPGVSSNEVLHFVAKDIVDATTLGVDGFTPDGCPVKIFLDVVGFVGDYPASAEAADVVGHVGASPCTLCSFRRLHHRVAKGSRYGYTTDVHANHSSYLRHGERHLALRTSNIDVIGTKRLGMVPNGKVSDRSCPLLYLQRELERNRGRIPLSEENLPVVTGLFDAYRSNVVAPDHLLTGLSKNILNAVYSSLPSDEMRLEVEIYICAALRDNGLLTQNEVFDRKKKKVHSMSLSSTFCVLLVSAPVFRMLCSHLPSTHLTRRLVQILCQFQALVGFTYWWPRREVDGRDAEALVHINKEVYFQELESMCKTYVSSVDRVCEEAPNVRCHLDKPNLHRIVELYVHTIPAFGHVREFMELVFECAHQPLKRCIARSNHRNAHISAVEHCVGNDWQGRLKALHSELSNGTVSKNMRQLSMRGLRRLLLGPEADLLNSDEHDVKTIDEVLNGLFNEPLSRQLHRDGRTANFSGVHSTVWIARGAMDRNMLQNICQWDLEVLDSIVDEATEWLQALYPVSAENTGHGIKLYRQAKRVKMNSAGKSVGGTSSFDVVSTNCVIQAYAEERSHLEKVVPSIGMKDGKLCMFAVLAFLQRRNDQAWAIGFKCTASGGKLNVSIGSEASNFQIVELGPASRRVALYHDCRDGSTGNISCRVREFKKDVSHSKSVLDGARMYFQRRVNGYPPRVA